MTIMSIRNPHVHLFKQFTAFQQPETKRQHLFSLPCDPLKGCMAKHLCIKQLTTCSELRLGLSYFMLPVAETEHIKWCKDGRTCMLIVYMV